MNLRFRSYSFRKHFPAFTLIELMVVVIVIGLLAGLVSFAAVSIQRTSRDTARDANVKVISSALEKYYRKNGEYPSVAFMTSQNIATIKQKLAIVSDNSLKLPLADDATKNSIVTSNPSTTRLLYSANTSDSTKNTQCQTDANGYCDGYTLQYKKEIDSSLVVISSLHDTFTPVAGTATCAQDETQNGNTCTKTYAATLQQGTYSCPSGGTLNNTTCTQTYAATYSSGGGYYTCTSYASLSGTNCLENTQADITPGYYSCPSYATLSGTTCGMQANTITNSVCPHPDFDNMNAQGNCRHERPNYTTSGGCTAAGYTWGGTNCFNVHEPTTTVTYYCNSGWSYNGLYCSTSASYVPPVYTCPAGSTSNGAGCTKTYPATYNSYSGGYYCNGGDSLSGSTCTKTYTATQGSSYYICPSGGTVSGSTCTYTYTLP